MRSATPLRSSATHPEFVHVIVGRRIVRSGGPEVAITLEADGYKTYEGGDAPRNRTGSTAST